MSKSYRKPWGTACSIKSSAHDDKTIAARSVRRAQEQSLREAVHDDDWDGWLLPNRYECTHNNVWGWGRDGKKRPLGTNNQYNNPYAYITSPTWRTEEEIFQCWQERKERHEWFIAWASRK